MLIHLALAAVLWLVGFLLFGHCIAPRWKVAGKLVFYLGVAAVLSYFFGPWALAWIVGHPLLGIGGHVWWCRRHGIDWLRCEPREKYLVLRPWAAQDGFPE